MEFKVFGKSLFSIGKNKVEYLLQESSSGTKQSKYLVDFYKGTGRNGNPNGVFEVVDGVVARVKGKKQQKQQHARTKYVLTPKGVYELKLLNSTSFVLNTDPAYIESQLADFKDKLALLSAEEYDMRNGVSEVTSVVSRLENRKRYPEVKEFFDQYPYTTTSLLEKLLKDHDYLKLDQIAQFVADLPKEAIEVMKEYNKATDKVCGKQAVFYIVADKKDFQKTTHRRDPILLAQSPFGHFWQILGAWDKEMLLLEEL